MRPVPRAPGFHGRHGKRAPWETGGGKLRPQSGEAAAGETGEVSVHGERGGRELGACSRMELLTLTPGRRP